MKAPLKKTIQNKFKDVLLSEDKLDALMALQDKEANTQAGSNKHNKVLSFSMLGLAALVLLTLSLFLVMPFNQSSMALKIANEVTHNHFKLKPLEIQSSILSDVSNYFTKLDFKPISSKSLNNKKLIGVMIWVEKGILMAMTL